jgi:MoaA/NifB/PqqE/SkfB family radical SAM enzyme
MDARDADQPFDGRVPPPDFVGIETTRFCNLRCRMCLQWNDGTTVTGPHMPLDEFTTIARSIFPYVSRWQPTVSGEPTMSRGFEDMLALAEHFGVKAEMFSNGTLLSPAMIARLAPNLGALSISFDGATPDAFEAIREGADYEQVVANVRALVAYCRANLRADLQPMFALNCTLMERNIRELPDLVRLAKELGMDQLSCYHVFPVTDEMKRQSLVHHRELARACIDEALAVAEAIGLPLHVQALDQLTAATAMDRDTKRAFATVNGVVEGLERRAVLQDRPRPWPGLDARHPDYAGIVARRAAARQASSFPEPFAGDSSAAADPAGAATEPIWFCDFLWNKTYVTIGGDVRPCCVDGVPVVGNVLREPFERVWNNASYRAMRQRLVARQPVPACRGCMHVREERDPQVIARHLRGARAPRTDELPELPAALDPKRQRRQRSGAPPVLEWPALDGAREYVLEFSLDDFLSVLFTTDGTLGGPAIPAIRTNRYAVPVWAWRDAPVDRAITWRALACLPDGRREVARGVVAAETAAPAAPAAS